MSSQVSVPTDISDGLLLTKSTGVIASVRLILAPLAFLVIKFEGFGPRESVNGIKALLVLYAAYAFALWVPDLRTNSVVQSIQRHAPLIDISCFTLLFAFSNSHHQTVFFCGFLFAILSAALNAGYASAL